MIIHIIGIVFVMGTSIGIGIYFIQKDRDRLHLMEEIKKTKGARTIYHLLHFLMTSERSNQPR